MTVHNAKGLEFEVVAVPDLARSLLAGGRAPLLALGREERAAGRDCSCAGSAAAAINLYDYGELLRGGAASATPRRACASSTSPPPAPGSG